MTGTPGLAAPDGPVAGLLLPVNGFPRVIEVAADMAPGSWRWPVRWADTVDGHPVAWCGERRNVAGLPANASAWVLAARLGWADLADRIGLNGELLVAGVDLRGRAGDVPEVVVRAAYRAGLLDRPMGGPLQSRRGVWSGVVPAGRA